MRILTVINMQSSPQLKLDEMVRHASLYAAGYGTMVEERNVPIAYLYR